ncbi:MAG: HDIG domain-containing metalloprotein [Bacteroidota bacterium]
MKDPALRRFWTWSSWSRYGLALVVVVFISFLFPQVEKETWADRAGGVWTGADLYAPAPLPLRRGDTATAPSEGLEQLPRFRLDRQRAEVEELTFAQEFQSQLTIVRQDRSAYFDLLRFPEKYLNYGKGLIRHFYDIGILPPPEVFDPARQPELLLDDGVATKRRSVNAFLTLEGVELAIGDSLFASGLAEAEFLFPLLQVRFRSNLLPLIAEEGTAGAPVAAVAIPRGALLVARGDSLGEEVQLRLEAYEEWRMTNGQGPAQPALIFTGNFLLTSLLIGLFLFYLQFHAPDAFGSWKKLSFMLLWLAVYSYLVYSLENLSALSVYVIPFCIAPLIIKVFFNDRLALFTHLIVILIASMLTAEGYEFTFLNLLAGIVVVLNKVELRNWSRFFYTIAALFVAYAAGFLGLSLIGTGQWMAIEWTTYRWLFLNVLLTLLAYPLIPLLERIFGFVSSITLIELSDMNQPLLKELSLVAPGTLQHSLQVANLAEAAANAIGAKPLLIKVAALYHDIGKVPQAGHFIENQNGPNPHDQLEPLQSAQLIIEHVAEGERRARKAKLPEVLIDFIRCHHGTTRVEYFYQRYRQQHPDRPVDPSAFRYPGPKPRSKEETILLLADSLEAASKSLQKPTEKELEELVDRIVAGKIGQGQLLESQLTFRELDRCVLAFKQLLKSIHHLRVEYPTK